MLIAPRAVADAACPTNFPKTTQIHPRTWLRRCHRSTEEAATIKWYSLLLPKQRDAPSGPLRVADVLWNTNLLLLRGILLLLATRLTATAATTPPITYHHLVRRILLLQHDPRVRAEACAAIYEVPDGPVWIAGESRPRGFNFNRVCVETKE